MQNKRYIIIALLGLTLIGFALYRYKASAHRKLHAARCSDFRSQEQAQAFYIANHAYYLDKNNDKKACNNLPK